MKKDQEYVWRQVMDFTVDTMEENIPLDVYVEDKRVCMMKREGKIYAIAAYCPHAGVPMCDGWIDKKGEIVCPKHKYRFDPANGRNTSGEGYKIKTYPLETMDGSIFIGLKPE